MERTVKLTLFVGTCYNFSLMVITALCCIYQVNHPRFGCCRAPEGALQTNAVPVKRVRQISFLYLENATNGKRKRRASSEKESIRKYEIGMIARNEEYFSFIMLLYIYIYIYLYI